MLLPLAWLVRVEDTPGHRAWLKRVAGDLLSYQQPCGAIREEVGSAGKGRYRPPGSNVGWLFPDPRAAAIDNYRRTGNFPIMHVVGVRRTLAERHPWLPAAILKAFDRAKAAVSKGASSVGESVSKMREGKGGGDDDRLAALERLSSLKDKGVLSEAEFEAEKKKILNSD